MPRQIHAEWEKILPKQISCSFRTIRLTDTVPIRHKERSIFIPRTQDSIESVYLCKKYRVETTCTRAIFTEDEVKVHEYQEIADPAECWEEYYEIEEGHKRNPSQIKCSWLIPTKTTKFKSKLFQTLVNYNIYTDSIFSKQAHISTCLNKTCYVSDPKVVILRPNQKKHFCHSPSDKLIAMFERGISDMEGNEYYFRENCILTVCNQRAIPLLYGGALLINSTDLPYWTWPECKNKTIELLEGPIPEEIRPLEDSVFFTNCITHRRLLMINKTHDIVDSLGWFVHPSHLGVGPVYKLDMKGEIWRTYGMYEVATIRHMMKHLLQYDAETLPGKRETFYLNLCEGDVVQNISNTTLTFNRSQQKYCTLNGFTYSLRTGILYTSTSNNLFYNLPLSRNLPKHEIVDYQDEELTPHHSHTKEEAMVDLTTPEFLLKIKEFFKSHHGLITSLVGFALAIGIILGVVWLCNSLISRILQIMMIKRIRKPRTPRINNKTKTEQSVLSQILN